MKWSVQASAGSNTSLSSSIYDTHIQAPKKFPCLPLPASVPLLHRACWFRTLRHHGVHQWAPTGSVWWLSNTPTGTQKSRYSRSRFPHVMTSSEPVTVSPHGRNQWKRCRKKLKSINGWAISKVIHAFGSISCDSVVKKKCKRPCREWNRVPFSDVGVEVIQR